MDTVIFRHKTKSTLIVLKCIFMFHSSLFMNHILLYKLYINMSISQLHSFSQKFEGPVKVHQVQKQSSSTSAFLAKMASQKKDNSPKGIISSYCCLVKIFCSFLFALLLLFWNFLLNSVILASEYCCKPKILLYILKYVT